MAAGNMSGWSRMGSLSCSCIASTWRTITGRLATSTTGPGNGVLLWFEVEDFEAAHARAMELGVEVVLPRHRNPPDGRGGPNHWELWFRDPDGYTVVMAGPYDSAGPPDAE